MKELTLKVITPVGAEKTILCDSVRLHICDGEDGKGGGSYGIHAGHVNAIFALEPGPLLAFRAGEKIFSVHCGSGFATVKQDVITLVAESIEKDAQ
ncbi:MAG: hypothetical protein IJP27_08425 [Clostridia bacterium]|nr:hypothetical protein [Clostridia bacterium]